MLKRQARSANLFINSLSIKFFILQSFQIVSVVQATRARKMYVSSDCNETIQEYSKLCCLFKLANDLELHSPLAMTSECI